MQKKKVTIKDIAQEVGVSPRSVSLAINNQGRLSEQTRQRILATAARLNYRPNILARGLVGNRTYLVGVAVPYLVNSFFANIIAGIERACGESGFDVILGNSSGDFEAEKAVIQRFVDRGVDGVICCPDPRHYEFYADLEGTGLPLIEIMTHVHGLASASILVDDVRGGELATKHLLDLGHRNIGFVTYSHSYYEEIVLRRDGYRKALIARGAALDLERYEVPSDLSASGGRAATSELIRRNKEMTAIFVPTDIAAVGAVEACLDAGLRVPEDMSIVGYDDIDLARYQARYPLTTIAQPKEEIGRLAFAQLHRLIEGEAVESMTLEPELVERRTTGPAPADASER